MSNHGGSRKGAGRKGGVPNKVGAEVRQLAQQYGPDALHALAKLGGVVIGEDGNPIGAAESESARVTALNSVLDRAYGKATQSMELSNDPDHPFGLIAVPPKA
jgi:hypothetical protein